MYYKLFISGLLIAFIGLFASNLGHGQGNPELAWLGAQFAISGLLIIAPKMALELGGVKFPLWLLSMFSTGATIVYTSLIDGAPQTLGTAFGVTFATLMVLWAKSPVPVRTR